MTNNKNIKASRQPRRRQQGRDQLEHGGKGQNPYLQTPMPKPNSKTHNIKPKVHNIKPQIRKKHLATNKFKALNVHSPKFETSFLNSHIGSITPILPCTSKSLHPTTPISMHKISNPQPQIPTTPT